MSGVLLLLAVKGGGINLIFVARTDDKGPIWSEDLEAKGALNLLLVG